MGNTYTKETENKSTIPQIVVAGAVDHFTSGGTATVLLVIFGSSVAALLGWIGLNHLKHKFVREVLLQLERPTFRVRRVSV